MRFLFLFFILFSVNKLKADAIDDNIMKGLELLYNVNFDEAKSYFDKSISIDPTDPRGYLFSSNVHLWSYLFDNKDEQLSYFITLNDKTISVAEKRIKNNPNDIRSKLMLGMAYGYRAIGNIRAENFVAGAMSGRTCYDKLMEVVKVNNKEWDAYLGLGIFHFAFGSIPQIGQFVTGLSGIKGDSKLGLQEILVTSARGYYFKHDAKFINALLDIYYKNEKSKGLGVLQDMNIKYPKSVPLYYVIGTAYSEAGEVQKALPYFDKIIKDNNKDFKVFTALSYARSGMSYFLMNDFSKSKIYLQSFLKNYNEKLFKTQVWSYLGICYEIEGNRENALKSYQRAKSTFGKTGEDISSKIKIMKLISNPLDAIDIDIIKGLNFIQVENFNDALTISKKLSNQQKLKPEQISQINYILGSAYFGLKNYNIANDFFAKAIASSVNSEEKWVPPFCYFYMSEGFKILGDLKKSKDYLQSARNFKNYENEHLLRFKIERNITLID
ncbi:MAG: tetratricopeptide repeat protein [Chlorobi bacterium]|nr:tetratricopeptide repeat protein [Chlorobiota bacterium]